MIVHALRTWICYLEGVDCVVVTDHNPLTYLKSQQVLLRCQTRWLECFEQNFTYRWEYRLGHNNIADPLSCKPLGSNAYDDVLNHDPLGCRDVKLKTLLVMSCLMLSFGEMVVDISKGAPRAVANDVCRGHECVNE